MKIILPLVVLILLLGGFLVFSAIQTKKSPEPQKTVNPTVLPSTSTKPPSLKNLQKLENEAEKAFSGNQDEEIVEKLKMAEKATDNSQMYKYLVEAFNLMKDSYEKYLQEEPDKYERHQNMIDIQEDLKNYAKKNFTEYKDSDFIIPN